MPPLSIQIGTVYGISIDGQIALAQSKIDSGTNGTLGYQPSFHDESATAIEAISGHPFLVYRAPRDSSQVYGFILTSFGNKSLDERYPPGSPHRGLYMAIGNTRGVNDYGTINCTYKDTLCPPDLYCYVKIGLGMSLDKKALKPLYDAVNYREYYPQVYQESFSAMMPIYERLHKMTLPQHLPKTPAKRARINDNDANSYSRRDKNHRSSQVNGVHRIYLSPTTYFMTEQEMDDEQRLLVENNQALEKWRHDVEANIHQ
jgi:hypothetical protein